ncbi:MAG: hypothetical protein ACC652_04080, partial [Acidimicrobiales bacterium]
MSALRSHVADQLNRKVAAHGLVVWDDPEQAYQDSAATLMPEDTEFVAFDGSWYAVRRHVEGLLGQATPPRLVVYIP